MKIAIVGGTGMLGRLVGDALRASGGTSVTLVSRSGAGEAFAQGRAADLLSGEGLDVALAGHDVAIWTAHDRDAALNDALALRNFIAAAQGAGVGHLVYTGIVGIETALASPYYAGKAIEENVLAASGAPFTLLRAAQFHELVLTLLEACDDGQTIRAPAFMLRPVAAQAAAEKLAALAMAGPAGRVADLVGPRDARIVELARDLVVQRRLTRKIVEAVEAPERWRILASLTHGPAERAGPDFRTWLSLRPA